MISIELYIRMKYRGLRKKLLRWLAIRVQFWKCALIVNNWKSTLSTHIMYLGRLGRNETSQFASAYSFWIQSFDTIYIRMIYFLIIVGRNLRGADHVFLLLVCVYEFGRILFFLLNTDLMGTKEIHVAHKPHIKGLHFNWTWTTYCLEGFVSTLQSRSWSIPVAVKLLWVRFQFVNGLFCQSRRKMCILKTHYGKVKNLRTEHMHLQLLDGRYGKSGAWGQTD